KPAAKAPEPAKPVAKAPEPPKPEAKASEPAKPATKASEPAKPVAKVPEPPKPVAKAAEPIAVEEKSPAPLPEEPAKPLPEIPKHVEPFTIPKGSGPTYVNKFQVYDENAPAAEKPAPVKSRAALDLEEIFEGNAEMAPFEKQSNEVKWVRISIREPVALPIDYHRIFKDPFIISSYEKYNHFILGHVLDPDVDMYIIGVPCTYSQQNLTTAKNLGFTQFKCVDNVLPANGEYGYCLLCVPLEC
ncbi:MAG: hypothetical protein LBC41_05405, partial [Clostridiales bacterium]|nr:hypothetical protein [Clostridiales bacterium]